MFSNFRQAFKPVFFAKTSEKTNRETTPPLHKNKTKSLKSAELPRRTHDEVLADLDELLADLRSEKG